MRKYNEHGRNPLSPCFMLLHSKTSQLSCLRMCSLFFPPTIRQLHVTSRLCRAQATPASLELVSQESITDAHSQVCLFVFTPKAWVALDTSWQAGKALPNFTGTYFATEGYAQVAKEQEGRISETWELISWDWQPAAKKQGEMRGK